nr:YetF domain-containing protein [Bacillus piscicola]
MLNGFLALAVWSALTIIIDFWNIKSKRFRKLVTGDAVIVIKNGVIVEDALRKVRLDIDSLRSLLRKKNVFSVADVAFAVFETDGKLSVLKKENKQTVTNESLNPAFVPVNPDFLPTEVISDGTVNQKNIKKLNLRENWITHQIKNAGLSSVSDVFYAELQKDGTLFIDHKKQPSPS